MTRISKRRLQRLRADSNSLEQLSETDKSNAAAMAIMHAVYWMRIYQRIPALREDAIETYFPRLRTDSQRQLFLVLVGEFKREDVPIRVRAQYDHYVQSMEIYTQACRSNALRSARRAIESLRNRDVQLGLAIDPGLREHAQALTQPKKRKARKHSKKKSARTRNP